MSKFVDGCTPHIIPIPRMLIEMREMERHIENVRWRNDPLRLKERFLDPIAVFVAEQLRAIANRLDP